MRLVEYLIQEAVDPSKLISQFNSDFQRDNPEENTPTTKQIVGALNRRAHSPGKDKVLDYITNWFLNKGLLQRKGGIVTPTAAGSQFRQVGSNSFRTNDIGKAADQGYKALRKYFMDVTDAATKEYLTTLDEPTVEALGKAHELNQEDIAILNGIRDRAENHRERQSYVNAMMDKNPERLERLISLGFIDPKTYGFNKGAFDAMVERIKALDPARIKTLIPDFYQWATHSAGNVARNINKVLFAIHPESRNRSEKGRHVWDIIKNLDDNTFNMLKNGKKPKQNTLSDDSYALLTTAVPAIMRSFPDAESAEQLISDIDDAFKSRVDFKSIDRSADKTAARRQGVRDTLRSYGQ